MAAKVTFFQVGNGDMTLVRLADTQGIRLCTTSTTLVSGWTISAVSVPCANFCAV